MKKNYVWTIAALFFALIITFGYLQSNVGPLPPRTPQDNAFNQKWFNTPLEDAATGRTFRLTDFRGKPILVELMAIWCPLCLEQGDEISKAKTKVGDKAAFVSVDIDPNETRDSLARYARQYRRDWFFSIDPNGVFNDFFRLSPPATPIIVIDKRGEIMIFAGSILSADRLIEIISQTG